VSAERLAELRREQAELRMQYDCSEDGEAERDNWDALQRWERQEDGGRELRRLARELEGATDTDEADA
jgi:hypothetical protein